MVRKSCIALTVALCTVWPSPRAVAEMRPLNTPHYRILTDLQPRLAEDLALRMEAMYREYSLRLTDFNPQNADKFQVYLFQKRRDYAVYTQDKLLTTGGIFIPSRNLLAAFLDGQGRDGLRRTLQHEAFHQFAHACFGRNMPVWLNEGIAQVFEEGIWTGKQFMIGQVPPRRLRQLELDLKERRWLPFREFVSLDETRWGKDLADARTSAARYDQAWAMTHFLIFATDDAGQPRYRTRMIVMLKSINQGQKPSDAFVDAFSDNFEGFEQRFMEYARTLRPSREATFLEYQGVLADMLIMLDKEGQRFDDIDEFRAYLTDGRMRLRYTKGDVQWSTATDPMTYFRDAAGRLMQRDQLYFSLRGGAPLPDIVCRPIDGLQFRTIFHDAADRPDHETIIETRTP